MNHLVRVGKSGVGLAVKGAGLEVPAKEIWSQWTGTLDMRPDQGSLQHLLAQAPASPPLRKASYFFPGFPDCWKANLNAPSDTSQP